MADLAPDRRRRLFRNRFGKPSQKPPKSSIYCFKRPTLGDKLQTLARHAPAYVVAIEAIVDQMIRKLSE